MLAVTPASSTCGVLRRWWEGALKGYWGRGGCGHASRHIREQQVWGVEKVVGRCTQGYEGGCSHASRHTCEKKVWGVGLVKTCAGKV